MKPYFLTFFLTLSSFSILAQQTLTEENTIENQFDKIYRISTSYQTYKVISKEGFQKLKTNVLDSLGLVENTLSEKISLLETKESDIQRLNEKITKTQVDLNTSIQKENSISLLGLSLNKTTYNSILWFLIITLLLGMLFFMYKFSNSNLLTKEAKHNLTEVEQELSQFRKKTLEKEQKLRRQLQDEINKQRNS